LARERLALLPGIHTWPRSGQPMSLLGFRLAFEECVPVQTERFIAAIKNEDDPLGTQANLLAAGPASWRHHSGELMRSVCAFARGLMR
jgi:hypothetical protein